MLGYAKKAIKQFERDKLEQRQDSPVAYTKPNYGTKKQYAHQESTAKPVDKKTDSSRKCVVNFCTWGGQSTVDSSYQSVPLHPSKQIQQSKTSGKQSNF